MIDEISHIFMHQGIVNQGEMYNIIKKMSSKKKYEKYKAHLDMIINSIELPKNYICKDNKYDITKISFIISIVGLLLTILGIILTIVFRP